jgi:hypothetical protein
MKNCFTVKFLLFLCALSIGNFLSAQIVINEGSNKNYQTAADEDGAYDDWIELYNAGSLPVDLYQYSLTDDPQNPQQWTFPHHIMQPGEFLLVFCSGKDRFESPTFSQVLNTGTFTPQPGINTHVLSQPFQWDGTSNLVINTCSFSSNGYITNSIFNQSNTAYVSCTFAYADYSPASCGSFTGSTAYQRPNIRVNNSWIGNDVIQNCNTCYPAPYGNWYWGSRHQMLIRAQELVDAGLTAGSIDSLSFDIVATDSVVYDYIEFQIGQVSQDALSEEFIALSGYSFHTNFKISGDGETVHLFDPNGTEISSLNIALQTIDMSTGLYPNGNTGEVQFYPPTPGASNNDSAPLTGSADAPQFSVASGFYATPMQINILDPNTESAQIYYTLDGSDPNQNSNLYTGIPVYVYQTTVLKARAYVIGKGPSSMQVATYFYNVDHITPIISIVTTESNLYGPTGIFDNPFNDWDRDAWMEYYDSTAQHNLLFTQATGMRMDGGAGGSRSQPQRSFRLEMADGVLGGLPMAQVVIPNIPERNKYSKFYIRNGSNQYNVLPYKDACQTEMMGKGTFNYYMGWRPVSVYINGQYFGLYELREKFDNEMFTEKDNATSSTIDLLSQSYYYGGTLRAISGDAQNFWNSYNSWTALDVSAADYWERADSLIDMRYYADYICAEDFMCNTDWPYNNIKLYRSDATSYRWRFGIQDLELGLQPNGWTSCTDDHISMMLNSGWSPYVNVWVQSMNNPRFRNYFINRYADLLNTRWKAEKLVAVENNFFNQTVTEMQNQFQRWGDPWNIPGQIENYYNNHITFQDQLTCRPDAVRGHIQNNFQLGAQINLTLQVEPAGAGRILINSIVPDSLPWTGIYFNGNPVTVTAVANPGFTFDHWSTDAIDGNTAFSNPWILDLLYNGQITAHFNGEAQDVSLVISEINYNSDGLTDPGDWFEIHNTGSADVDLTGWKAVNQDLAPEFAFPNGIVIPANGYLVVARDTVQFRNVFPTQGPLTGPFVFSLSSSGGTISLRDFANNVVVQATFDDTLAWPKGADGTGRTLEWRDNATNQNDPLSWFDGCILGSPGAPYTPCEYKIVFSEINYRSAVNADFGDWVELRNVSTEPVNIGNWNFKDSQNTSSFAIPANTTLPPGGMLVLSANQTALLDSFPTLTNTIGNFSFGLSSNGELIRLYDASGKLAMSMVYGSSSPWPTTPNGVGYTLELADSTADFNRASAWFAGCLYGSPGKYYHPCGIGVQNLNEEIRFVCYPNPAEAQVRVQCKGFNAGALQLWIVDALGRKTHLPFKRTNDNQLEFSVNDLANGLYVINITDGSQIASAPLVVSH